MDDSHPLAFGLGEFLYIMKRSSTVHKYLEEGFFEKVAMPKMKAFDDRTIDTVVQIFRNQPTRIDRTHLNPYWSDYTLFADRYFKKKSKEDWKNMFQTEELKEIAISSITK